MYLFYNSLLRCVIFNLIKLPIIKKINIQLIPMYRNTLFTRLFIYAQKKKKKMHLLFSFPPHKNVYEEYK